MKWKKNETQNSEARIEKLADEVRSAAYGPHRQTAAHVFPSQTYRNPGLWCFLSLF